MAATILGFGIEEMKAQPGLSISRTDNGGWSANHEIVIKVSDFSALAPNFAKGELLAGVDPSVPEPFDSFLRIDQVTFVRTEGDLITFNVVATGAGFAQFQPGEEDGLTSLALPTYNLDGQLVDAPLWQHRKWTPLSDADKKLLGLLLADFYSYNATTAKLFRVTDDNNFVDAPEQLTADDAKSFAALIQQGVTTYDKSVYTWTETTEGADQLTPPQINNLGLISTPRGTPPEAGGTRNWKLTSASQSQSGQLYRTNLVWTLSDAGGHNAFLYED